MSEAPQIEAIQRGAQLVFWCKYCGKEHYHGASGYGHRVAHCFDGSPYKDTGYVLVPPKRGGDR